MTAGYLPAGIGSKSPVGSTWLASNPRKSAMGLPFFWSKGVGQGRHERRPRQGQLNGEAVTVLGDAGRAADAAQDALAAVPAEGMGDGPLAAEAGVLGLGADLAGGEQDGVAPLADQGGGALVQAGGVAVV